MKPIKHTFPVLVMAAALLVSFGAVAHAAGAVEPTNGSLLDLLKPVLLAFQGGHYAYAGALALVLAVAATRHYGEPKYPWLASDAGSSLLVFAGALGTSCAASWSSGAAPTWSSIASGLKIALGALGGYAAVKKLVVEPYLTKLATKGPAWLHKPADLVLWIFQEAAPDRAVASAPPVVLTGTAVPADSVSGVSHSATNQGDK